MDVQRGITIFANVLKAFMICRAFETHDSKIVKFILLYVPFILFNLIAEHLFIRSFRRYAH